MLSLSRLSNLLLRLVRWIVCPLCAKLCPQKPPPPPKRRLEYFVPGQINVLTFHQKGIDKSRIAQLIRSDALIADGPLPGPLFVAPQRIITFEFSGRQQAFSLGFVDVPNLRDDPVRLVQLIHAINRQIGHSQEYGRETGPKRPGSGSGYGGQSGASAEAAGDLSEAGLADQAGAEDAAFSIQLAAPNWLSSGAPYVGGGGPGSKPIALPAASITANSVTNKLPWEFTLPPDLQIGADGADVEVAILDTVPDQINLDLAYQQWGSTNPLIGDLLGPAGTLQITRGGFSNLMQLADGTLDEHAYLMPDHGLFVASIIRSLAPMADLHLVEALNPYGLGTVETIALALQQFANRPAGAKPLLINLSLVLNIPPADLLAALAAQDPLWQPFTQQTLAQSGQVLELVCSELSAQNVFLLAAAGNDGDPSTNPHPLPHYPAAYHTVVGVGALNADDSPTTYSNAGDDLLAEGMAVFGGNIDPSLNGDADPQHGMVGVYISPQFPSAQINDSGLARWSGTSFATPTLTGTVAKLVGPTGSPNPAQAIVALRAIDLSPISAVGESVHIAQG
jgi:Subtilase family